MKKWVISKLDKDNAKRIAAEFNIHILPAMLIDIMGFEDDEEIAEFLSEDFDFSDPFLVTDMDKAVIRITKAVQSFERICVYGDYDADGVTSTALLYSYLVSIGANVMYYIPSRENEGYGLNNNAVDVLKEQGVSLIITVDNGISACEQIDYASSLGIQTVVTDHHTPPAQLPNAIAVVNPHREDDISPFKHFSGVGIVFKLCMAMDDDGLNIDELLDKFSDIAAIGTVGDVVSLSGENRSLVKAGLRKINNGDRIGIAALKQSAGYAEKELSAGNVAFTLVPRINAGGRLGLSQKSVKLLLSEDSDEAREIAEELSEDNRNRQEIEQEILKQVEQKLDNDEYIKYRKIIVVAGEGWHQGVIGIAAARIKDKYGKPTIIISYDGENAKGSARSIEGFAMCDGVAYCKELLTVFGGHPMAAGMSLPTANIDLFREKINEYADSLNKPILPILNIACKLNPSVITVEMAESLEILEPYGSGNPTPVFGIYNLTLNGIIPLKGGKHLRLLFSRNNANIEALYFNMPIEKFPYINGDTVNLAVTLDVNTYNNVKKVSLLIKDMGFSSQDNEKQMLSSIFYDSLMSGMPVTLAMKEQLTVNREDCAAVYRYLRANKGFAFTADILQYRIGNDNINVGKLMVILKAMTELNLITMKSTVSSLNIQLVENPPKVNILSAPILQKLL
ncbi:MAG: single-stranded-DNA-specific exonuclease RecJ [Lachnospiraceae bacterium]|nr:single-stranded-DNA-specific exonuclease RecJ [Lachnospiraceae bacterium]